MTSRRYSRRPLRRNGEGAPSVDLFEWANLGDLQVAPLAVRHLARRFGLQIHIAQLVSELSGLRDGGEP
jgi:hypothetical protein